MVAPVKPGSRQAVTSSDVATIVASVGPYVLSNWTVGAATVRQRSSELIAAASPPITTSRTLGGSAASSAIQPAQNAVGRLTTEIAWQRQNRENRSKSPIESSSRRTSRAPPSSVEKI